jgi:capsular polysaccharide biosynthesis protein
LLDGYVKQLELAKVDEAKEGPTVQVVDEAKAPEMRAKPERKKLVIAYTVTGLIIAFVLAACVPYCVTFDQRQRACSVGVNLSVLGDLPKVLTNRTVAAFTCLALFFLTP